MLRFLQIQEVSHVRFAEEAATQAFFKLAIRPGKAVMLTKVLRPGTHDTIFDIAVGGLKVRADPHRGAERDRIDAWSRRSLLLD